MSVPVVKLSSIIAPSFHDVHKAIKSGEYDEIWLKGGRGSTKSSFAAIETILKIINDPDANAIVFRKVGDTIRGSVHALLLWAIDKLEVHDFFDATTSPAEITYRPTGQKILFRGLDKPTKIKSITLKKGWFKISWYEECEEFNGMEEIRNTQQSVARGTDDHISLFSFNPPNDPANWVNIEVAKDVPRRFVHSSTYLDVPPEWLGRVFIEKAKTLKENDQEAYDHEYLGIAVGKSDRIIFSGKWKELEFTPQPHWEPYYGCDWGFSGDPNVITRVWIDWGEHWRDLYVEYAEYGYRTEIEDLPDLFMRVPGTGNAVIRADSARPETISYMRRNGFQKIVAAKKGAGSVEDGIEWLRGFRTIYFHPRCVEAMDEARYYSYKVNRAGDVTSDIVDDWNHCFVGDTMIATINGDVPIKDIRAGDYVLTRFGYRKVIETFNNGLKPVNTYKLINGKSLTCTDTHEIITPDKKVKIKDLNSGHKVFYRSGSCTYIEVANQRLQYLKAKNTEDILTVKDGLIEFISEKAKQTKDTNIFTLKFIKNILAIFLMVIIFTIKMVILQTILLIIWKLCIAKSIYQIIGKNITRKIKAPLTSIWMKLGIWHQNGIKAKRVGRGTKITIKSTKISSVLKRKKNAIIAEIYLKGQKQVVKIRSALMHANRLGEENRGLITLLVNASFVKKILHTINTAKQRHAQGRVQIVYDIAVDENHEYFANGILVSNCWDATRYALEPLIRTRETDDEIVSPSSTKDNFLSSSEVIV